MTSEQVAAPTRRDQMKADRRRQLLDAAARLIAERGFVSVRLEDLGAAVGISGPAVYRHFPNKDAVLVELLVGISTRLHEGGSAAAEAADSPSAALDALVEFQPRLRARRAGPDPHPGPRPPKACRPTRVDRYARRSASTSRCGSGCSSNSIPNLDQADARIKAHATFGLINSTPHSANPASPARARRVLRNMTLAALRTH